MALNAKSIYDSEFSVFVPLRDFAPLLAGSADYANSAAWMVRGALLLGTILSSPICPRVADGCYGCGMSLGWSAAR